MATTYTHFLVTWVSAAKRDDAREALRSRASVDVASYAVPLERLDDLLGLDLGVNALLAEGWAEWSVCRPGSEALFAAAALATCPGGVVVEADGTTTYIGAGGGWIMWPRKATPSEDRAAALAWLGLQGWQVVSDPEPVVQDGEE